MLTATGLVRCVFLVVVSLLIYFVDCVPMGYQTLGMVGASTRRTPLTSFTKTVQRGETPLKPLASPMVQALRGTTPHKPLASPHGTTPIKPSTRA